MMHRINKRWLAAALFVGLVLAGASLAQPPGPRDGFPKDAPPPPPISVEEIVERIMAFDKNKDGKVTRDELPERMQHLIELGDTNGDGALDKEEIRKLAIKLAASPGGSGGDIRVSGFGVGPGPRAGPGPLEGIVDDLKLPGQKKEQALAAVKAHEEHVRKLMDQARAELLEQMKEILSEEEFKDFRAALDRPRGQTFFNPDQRGAFQAGGEKRSEPPRK
jgi:hypothetical protein